MRYLLAASALGAALMASSALARSGDHRASSMTGDARSDLPEMAQTKEPAATPPPARQASPSPAPAPAGAPATVRVGPHTKPATARVLSSEAGDRGCYMRIADERGVTSEEIAEFELCERKPSLTGRRVTLTWRLDQVQAASCQGDVNCKKTDLVPLIVGARPIN
ncbi:MAG: hypothetical protein FJX20_15935 [Alphaproteobacteria bacterium]|nr:hypothetical protein [Alphaproteobacteria bacterium]